MDPPSRLSPMSSDTSLATRLPSSPTSQSHLRHEAAPPWIAALRLLRPRQWVKNLLVLAPLVFAGAFLHLPSITAALLATVLFSLTASAGYVYNDLQDIEADRRHPVKRHTRPLASGELTPAQGWTVLGVLVSVLAASPLLVPWTVTVSMALYLALVTAYSTRLKQIPVLDLFVISVGFVLRVYAGAEAIEVPLSAWMAVTTLCLALYLGTVKRIAELEEHGDEARSVLSEYDGRTLEGFALISATCASVFYGLYAAVHRPQLVLTLPLVLFGFFRYWHLVRTSKTGSSPIRDALSDVPTIGGLGVWTLWVIYLLWPG